MISLLGLLVFIPPLLSEGDQEFVRTNYVQAAAIYDSALAVTADSADVLWRLARVYVCIADIAPAEEKVSVYRKADEFAQRCIHADSTTSEGHTWRAAALGNIAMFEGGKTKVKLTHVIKHELDVAITLNPNDDIAYSILGSFYLALGDLSWFERQLAAVFLGSLPDGGYEEAEQALKRAIAIAPNIVRHHFELGKLYMALDREQEALGEFQKVITLPMQMGGDQLSRQYADKFIKKIQEG